MRAIIDDRTGGAAWPRGYGDRAIDAVIDGLSALQETGEVFRYGDQWMAETKTPGCCVTAAHFLAQATEGVPVPLKYWTLTDLSEIVSIGELVTIAERTSGSDRDLLVILDQNNYIIFTFHRDQQKTVHTETVRTSEVIDIENNFEDVAGRIDAGEAPPPNLDVVDLVDPQDDIEVELQKRIDNYLGLGDSSPPASQ
jgi:hypothetical protein